ncbi:MAG: hypothetical protein BGO41_10770 [Clostridiales bacterium 38-18]|nr:MAG: hypothetical protein BGO41_10770 [Clostridiales bacterium 38-18]
MTLLGKEHKDAIFELCQRLIEENARMSFTDIENIEHLEKWFNDTNVLLYGKLNEAGQLIAMVKATRGVGNKAHSCYLAAATHPDYRKESQASSLTNEVLDDLKNRGVLIARTYIYSWNHASIKTIEKCGFTLSGRVVMHEYDEITGDYIDDLIYYKRLV